MSSLIENIYQEMYSEKLTFFNLVNNIKEENYISVNFSKEDGKVVCETSCILKTSELAVYKYYFLDDKLVKLIEKINSCEKVLYNRDEKLRKLVDEYKNSIKNSDFIIA